MLLINNMEEKQLHHYQVNFENLNKIQVDVFLETMDSPANLGSIFRNAEAFGVKTLYVNESNRKDLESTRFKRTSRSTWKNLHISFYENYQTVFKAYQGLKVGLEITSKSNDITHISKLESDKILMVLGNEKSGISEDILQKLDKVYHIKMFGKNSSLNVSQTLGIALHEVRR